MATRQLLADLVAQFQLTSPQRVTVESVGGVAYLASLTEGLPRRPVIEEYIRIVKDKSLLRKLMLICSAAIARAADQGETALLTFSDAVSDADRSTARGPGAVVV